MKKNRFLKRLLKVLFITLSTTPLLAQSSSQSLISSFSTDQILWAVIAFEIFLIFLALILVYIVVKTKGILFPEEKGFFEKLKERITDSVPVEKEADVMLDHHYDGIRELDNNLPPWWKFLFYATIAFSVFYIGYFHVYGAGKLSKEEYLAEMEQAEKEIAEYIANKANSIDETNVIASVEPADLGAGKKIFDTTCSACHGKLGEGGIGPNFTDQYWIHGGDIKNIFKVVKYGVPQKGMKAWQKDLTPLEMQQVSSFIITLEGTNPPNGKAPQGELFVREKKDEKS